MPPKVTKTKTTVTQSTPQPQQQRRRKQTRTVTTVSRPYSRRRRSQRGVRQSALNQFLYMLNNPFDSATVRAGYGTLVPTQVATAYFRSAVTVVNNDFAGVMVIPALTSSILVYNGNSASGVLLPQGQNFTNSGQLQSTMTQARVLAGGLRIFPLISANTAPYMVYCGLAPSPGSASAMNSLVVNSTVSTFRSMSTSQLHMVDGSKPVEILFRPEDLSTYEFDKDIMTGTASNSDFGPIMYCFLDAPVNSKFYFETILHLEGTATNTNLTNNIEMAAETHPSVSGESNLTLEGMMNYIRKGLTASSKIIADVGLDTSSVMRTARMAHAGYQKLTGMYDDYVGVVK